MAHTLTTLERIIEKGETAAIESGKALKTIRDERLYKTVYSSFDQYLDERWGMSRQRSHQLIMMAELSTHVDVSGLTEGHARPLARLSDDRIPEAVKLFRELPENKQTCRAMQAIVERVELRGSDGEHPAAGEEDGVDLTAPLNWYGGKSRLSKFIRQLMPLHSTYVEPFFGGGSILFGKLPSDTEIVSDVNSHVVNFFEILRDTKLARRLREQLVLTPYSREEHSKCIDPKPTGDRIEDARRFFVRVRQSFSSIEVSGTWSLNRFGKNRADDFANAVDRLCGDICQRLRRVQIENRCFSDLLPKCDHPETLIYADPTYPTETRTARVNAYQHEMTDEQHHALLKIVTGYKHANVMISGYRCAIYDGHLKGWNRHEKQLRVNAARGDKKAVRTEVVWKNF